MTNSIKEVVERIPQTTILQEFIKESTQITEESIETVELTVNNQYIDYTLVTKTEEGIVQHEYLINIETKEVMEVNNQIISEDLPIVVPQLPEITIMPVEDKEIKPLIVEIIENHETNLEKVEEVVSISKETVTKGTKYEIEYKDDKKEVKKIIVFQNESNIPVIIDERKIIKDFVKKDSVIVKEGLDSITKVKTIVYPTVETFQVDESSKEITKFVEKAVVESKEYKI